MVSQLHQLLLELIPGGAKKDLSARQAKALLAKLAKVRPRDAAGKTRRRVAAELIGDLERVYQRKKAANKELTELVAATGTGLLDLNGIGPSGAARLQGLTEIIAFRCTGRELEIRWHRKIVLVSKKTRLCKECGLLRDVAENVCVGPCAGQHGDERNSLGDLLYGDMLASGELLHQFLDCRHKLLVLSQLLTPSLAAKASIEGRRCLTHGGGLGALFLVHAQHHAVHAVSLIRIHGVKAITVRHTSSDRCGENTHDYDVEGNCSKTSAIGHEREQAESATLGGTNASPAESHPPS
jgi:hypothetical protein